MGATTASKGIVTIAMVDVGVRPCTASTTGAGHAPGGSSTLTKTLILRRLSWFGFCPRTG